MVKYLTKTQMKEYGEILKQHRDLVGFSGWDMIIKSKCCVGDNYATCEPDIYENTLTVELSESFIPLDYNTKRSILIHELIHGRYEAYEKIIENLKEFEEERMINDIERGFKILLEKTDKVI